LERDEHKEEMDCHDKLMDLMLNHFEEYPMQRDEIVDHIQTKYHEHRGKYEELCSILTSLELSIEILLCYIEK
jgi:hypothetical protein